MADHRPLTALERDQLRKHAGAIVEFDECHQAYMFRCGGVEGRGPTAEKAIRDWLTKDQAEMHEDRDF